jgi:hypothetical protein
MVSKSLPPAYARVLTVNDTHALLAPPQPATILLFAVSGAVEVRASAAGAATGEAYGRLEPWDFAVAPAGTHVTLTRAAAAPALVFCALLEDPHGR